MNKDKRIDIVAARYMGGVGELLWLQQPYEKDGGWNIRKIHEGRFQIKLETPGSVISGQKIQSYFFGFDDVIPGHLFS